jgi:tetratricopeptide (TPR) repeat protein
MTSDIDQALAHHQAGRLQQAEAIYRQILQTQPDDADALHLLGVIAHQVGDHARAIALIQQAVARRPNEPAFHSNLGEALRASGQLEAAVNAFRKALALKPEFADAHGNLGAALIALGRNDEAIESLQVATRINPDFLEAHMNLGNALKDQGRFEEAAASFARVTELNPAMAEAHVNLGNVLKRSGNITAAYAHYQQAIRLSPELGQAHMNLALLLTEQARFDQAKNAFQKVFHLTHGNELWNAPRFTTRWSKETTPIRTTRFALINSVEHIEHLIGRGKLDPSFAQMARAYRAVLAELTEAHGKTLITLTPGQSARIAGFYGKVVHFVDAPRIAPPVVNPKLDFREIEDAYLASPVAVIHFDDFLSPAALHALYDFCLESTIFVAQAQGEFLSSYVGDGFQCSLLFQIVEELKQRFPRLLGNQVLGNMWVYRYPSEGEGVRAHTDEGSVTFNFWITPDEANLEPQRGGLVIYTKEQPLDWDWRRFNLDKDDPAMQKEIQDFLHSADAVAIPYRGNRALLFHSNLFHRSDYFHFKDDYRSRRMNVTLLFGERGTDVRLRYV